MSTSIAGKDLEGKYLVVRKEIHSPGFQDLPNRIFLATGGFGCQAGARGSAVLGTYVIDGEKCRRERRDFERLAYPEEVAEAEKVRKGTK